MKLPKNVTKKYGKYFLQKLINGIPRSKLTHSLDEALCLKGLWELEKKYPEFFDKYVEKKENNTPKKRIMAPKKVVQRDSNKLTLSDLINEASKNLVKKDRKVYTIWNEIGQLHLEDLNVPGRCKKEIGEFVNKLKPDFSNATINRYRAALSKMLTSATNGEYGEQYNFLTIKAPQLMRKLDEEETRREKELVTSEQLKEFWKWLSTLTSTQQAVYGLCALTGRRIGEILKIESRDIKLEGEVLEILIGKNKTKTKKVNTILRLSKDRPIQNQVIQLLIELRNSNNGYIFLRPNGDPYCKNASHLSTNMTISCGFSPHYFRGYIDTLLLNKGIDTTRRKYFIGHSHGVDDHYIKDI